jgi:hypothetical protein
MKRKVVVPTLNGNQTIEGMTVETLRKAIHDHPDDAVVVFMFELTPTVRAEMGRVDLMMMPAHAVFGSPDLLAFVGPEIENAPFEAKQKWQEEIAGPPPVDRTNTTTTDNAPLDQSPESDRDGQHKNYVVLSPEERSKGFVRPYRDAYKHLKCGTVTTMGRSIAETYARDPGFYGATYCIHCKGHFPVGEDGEFVWHPADNLVDPDGPKVGT